MELTWLEDFVALAETGNFSRAARARHVTQPAFSRRIRSLEDWVGTPLFDRATHRVGLTEAGRQFRPAATETLRRLHQAREAAREAGSSEATALRFAATHSLSFAFFPDWLGSLAPSAAIGSVRLISDSMQGCEQVLANGQAHFLICHHHHAVPNRLDASLFKALPIGHDALQLAVAPDLAAQDPATLPYLAYSAESGLGRIVSGVHGRRMSQPPVFTSHLAAVLHSMVRNGRGAAWLPRSICGDDLAAGRLAAIGPTTPPIAIEIRLFRPRARQSAQAEAFWLLARAWAAGHGFDTDAD